MDSGAGSHVPGVSQSGQQEGGGALRSLFILLDAMKVWDCLLLGSSTTERLLFLRLQH
jgi:hypothetical protein